MPQSIRLSWRPAAILLAGLATAALPSQSQAAGEIYWFNLLTEDATAASTFYSGLFGWEIEPSPTGALMAVRNGTPIAGISQIEDRIPNASESLWLAAIAVADLGKSVATAKALGATVHQDITNLPGWGSFALLQDPQGAPVLLAVPERSLGGRQGYGGWRWAELWTQDTAGAADFYTKVVGYEREELQDGQRLYTAFRSSGQRNAGLIKLENPQLASRWAPYVGVTDLRATLVRVWELKGMVLREPSEVEFATAGANRVALIADPTGGMMFLYQLDERATVDPNIAAESAARNPPPARPSNGRNSNVSVTLHYGYGFGPGWGGLYPTVPYRYFGP